MAAARKTPARPSDSLFNLTVPFAPKTARAPRKQVTATAAETVETTKADKVVKSKAPSPVVPAPGSQNASVAAEPVKPRRRRLAKAFDRPLDKVLRKKSEEVAAIPPKASRATVRDSFTLLKAEHDRLMELKKVLAVQGLDVKKSDVIRVALLLALALPPTKLKSLLGKLPPAK